MQQYLPYVLLAIIVAATVWSVVNAILIQRRYNQAQKLFMILLYLHHKAVIEAMQHRIMMIGSLFGSLTISIKHQQDDDDTEGDDNECE